MSKCTDLRVLVLPGNEYSKSKGFVKKFKDEYAY